MASQTEENYLKALFFLDVKNPEIAISDLSKKLKVSTPTANSMVKKLAVKGLVKYEKYKPLILTGKGRKTAALIIRKHRLTEMYLVEEMGFGWEEVHDIAEQMEHLNSPAFFLRMDEILGFPSQDPHGSPIPDKEGNIQRQSYASLSSFEEGDRGVLSALSNSSKDFLDFLNSKNIQLGMEFHVKKMEDFDSSIEVEVDQQSLTLSKMVTDRLLMVKV